MKKAFTLIEMLVVVGIIAVLASIVLVNVRGASAAANAAKCMSNMRSLFVAMDAVGMSGGYPLTGPCIRIDKELNESTVEPWISRSRSGQMVPCYGSGSDGEDRFALTNGCGGVFWQAIGGNESAYNCPIFAKDHLVKRKRMPLFSYALNAVVFRSNEKHWYEDFVGSAPGLAGYPLGRADRKVMFAELPIKVSCSYDPLANPETCDATLKPNEKNNWWTGNEEIGFVHQDKSKKYFGHVIYADGHVEKFMQPPTSSSLKANMLTAHICSGRDVISDANGYSLAVGDDGEEDEDDE